MIMRWPFSVRMKMSMSIAIVGVHVKVEFLPPQLVYRPDAKQYEHHSDD